MRKIVATALKCLSKNSRVVQCETTSFSNGLLCWRKAMGVTKHWQIILNAIFCHFFLAFSYQFSYQNFVTWSSQEIKLTKLTKSDKIWRSWKSVNKQLFGAVVTHCSEIFDAIKRKANFCSWQAILIKFNNFKFKFQHFVTSVATHHVLSCVSFQVAYINSLTWIESNLGI